MPNRRVQIAMDGTPIGGVVPLRYVGIINKRTTYAWKCWCGEEFQAAATEIRVATRKFGKASCGCLWRAAIRAHGQTKRTHGFSVDRPKLYDVYKQMMRRCYNQKSKDFPGYGGRGIIVDIAWHDIHAFMVWADASGYREGLTIERVDCNGNYAPCNCTWIPNELQGHNTRRLKFLTFNGETLHLSEWARRLDISVRTIIGRLHRGWSVDEILTIPPVRGRNQRFSHEKTT